MGATTTLDRHTTCVLSPSCNVGLASPLLADCPSSSPFLCVLVSEEPRISHLLSYLPLFFELTTAGYHLCYTVIVPGAQFLHDVVAIHHKGDFSLLLLGIS